MWEMMGRKPGCHGGQKQRSCEPRQVWSGPVRSGLVWSGSFARLPGPRNNESRSQRASEVGCLPRPFLLRCRPRDSQYMDD